MAYRFDLTLVSVGPIRFGEPIEPVVQKLGLMPSERGNATNLRGVEDGDDFRSTVTKLRSSKKMAIVECVGCLGNIHLSMAKICLDSHLQELSDDLGNGTEIGEMIWLRGHQLGFSVTSLEIQVWLKMKMERWIPS